MILSRTTAWQRNAMSIDMYHTPYRMVQLQAVNLLCAQVNLTSPLNGMGNEYQLV